MPYIKENRKEEILKGMIPKDAGELNYQLTMFIQEYLLRHGEGYQTMNDIIGALEGCKLELYRRKVAPYEDKKIKENGDVY